MGQSSLWHNIWLLTNFGWGQVSSGSIILTINWPRFSGHAGWASSKLMKIILIGITNVIYKKNIYITWLTYEDTVPHGHQYLICACISFAYMRSTSILIGIADYYHIWVWFFWNQENNASFPNQHFWHCWLDALDIFLKLRKYSFVIVKKKMEAVLSSNIVLNRNRSVSLVCILSFT